MAEKLDDWINSHVKKLKKLPPEKIYNELFFREEMRPFFYDSSKFYSPADGVIIYQKVVTPDMKILEIKGKDYTLENIMQKEEELEDIEYYVVGVFMTLYDVHVNRMPTDGLLKYKLLDTIESNNLPMIFMEKGIFKNDINYEEDHNYLFNNERMLNKIVYNKKDITYWVVQIADVDVSVITPYSVDNPDFMSQGERFSFIRWGSQCDLIIPKHPKYKYKFLQKELTHVKAAVDPLIEIIEKE